MARDFDLREAINCVSDVVNNRPLPLREFDQIYMKVADMVIQAHYVARRFDNLDVVFVGDGDAIGLAVMHLGQKNIFETYPRRIRVLDFDERIVKSITRFAEKYGFADRMEATLYNVVDPLPDAVFGQHDAFYINPPWGASNGGESVFVFLERGIEACQPVAQGAMVVADDSTLAWTQEVLYASQKRAAELGFLVAEMIPAMHRYHLDDAPDLQSCTCVFRRADVLLAPRESKPLDRNRWQNFYGRSAPLRVRYVREKPKLNYGRAAETSYDLEPLE